MDFISYIPNLFDIFVTDLFGGFWLSIICLSLIFGLIMMLGGVSPYSIMTFDILFLLSMTLGYGVPIITVFVVAGLVIWSVLQITKFLSGT